VIICKSVMMFLILSQLYFSRNSIHFFNKNGMKGCTIFHRRKNQALEQFLSVYTNPKTSHKVHNTRDNHGVKRSLLKTNNEVASRPTRKDILL
jgi:hypothetical protein